VGLRFAIDAFPGGWGSARKGGRDRVRVAVDHTVELARIGDVTGIHSMWVLEDPDGWDAFAVLSAMARATERIRLGPGVTNPYYRHPSLIAASISTLDHLSDGRAFLGLGRGQSEWYEMALGMKVGKPPRALAEAIELLRQWWSPAMRASSPPEATEYHVDAWERVMRPLQDHVPIHLAAAGPVALGVAGRHADGVLFNDLTSMHFMRQAIERVRSQAAKAGRDPASLSFMARSSVTITDNPEVLYEKRKATVATIHALPGMDRLMEVPGFDTDRIMADVRQAMRTNEILASGGGFGDLRRGGDLAAAKRAIPNDLMAQLVVAGPAAEVRRRLSELEGTGITDVFLAPLDASATVESVATVLDAIRPGAS
jgi:5,10-methylenetetrahydromethanopterin reductase